MNKKHICITLIISIISLITLTLNIKADQVDDYPRIYDVDMGRELQEKLFEFCYDYGDIDPKLILAIIQTESNFDPNIISNTNDYGLMQINVRNHKRLSEELDITDFLEPIQNIKAGIYTVSGYLKIYPDYHQMLMVYNMGESGAKKLFKQGICQSEYSKKVMKNFDKIKFVKEIK